MSVADYSWHWVFL